MSDTSTRSGMLWEVERILMECKELGNLPSILIMENVPQIHSFSTSNISDFHKWQVRLEELGYKNYWQDLIATDYGIPQTRNRCFMISILGDYSYSFPKPIPLKLKLKDMLEDNVDQKYFLSEKMLNGMLHTNFNSYKLESRLQNINGTIDTLLTSSGSRCPHCIEVNSNNTNILKIKNATKKGYLEAQEGDGIDISGRMEYHRGTVQKNKTQSITTSGGGNNGVIIKNKNNLRIRKLTPRECLRLMGVKEEDITNMSKNQSDASLYHLAGDSIVVNVLMAIFKEIL